MNGKLTVYPGSPAFARAWLRPQDRLMACELEPQAAAALGAQLARRNPHQDIASDGWNALTAYVPPKERRGLVLIDPPFEEEGDFARLSQSLAPRTANGRPASTCSGIRSRIAAGPTRWPTAAPVGIAQDVCGRSLIVAPLAIRAGSTAAASSSSTHRGRCRTSFPSCCQRWRKSSAAVATGGIKLDWLAGESAPARLACRGSFHADPSWCLVLSGQ